MVSLGNFGFVRDNLFFTKDNCNGIESYCLYFVLSVCDYFKATNDTQTARQLADAHVTPKLERA
jgi:alpha-L-rhamnosidase